MTSEAAAAGILVVSLVFAALVDLSSLFVPNDDDRQAVTFVLIAMWLVPFSYPLRLRNNAARNLSNPKESNTKEAQGS